MIDIDFNDYFIKNYNCYDLCRYTYHIRPKTRPHTDCSNNFFIYRAYKIETIYLKFIVNASNITQFLENILDVILCPAAT